MRDKFKKVTSLVAAATFCAAAVALAGCGSGYSTKVPGGDIFEGEVVSNGGFVVEKGNYIYFINGAEEYTASNKYGEVVKGALMRISKSDLREKKYENIVTVVPMLFVAQNYDAGIYIYGDYVYYASPTTEKDQSGKVQNDWISFKRAKLDGSDAMKDYYFRSDDNAVDYRYVQVEGVVYCLHADDKTLYSYNTQTGKDTVLVENSGSEFFFDTSDPEKPSVYYTMSVTQDLDTENSSSVPYTQVYSVRADAAVESVDASKASYTVKDGRTYSFDLSYLKDNVEDFDAKDYTTYPYVNLGELVLDGRGSSAAYTDARFTDDDPQTAATPNGYTYTIQSYRNGGLYYTRADVNGNSSDGEGQLYYLADSVKDAAGWKSISGNKSAEIDTVALNTTNASATALFSVEEKNGKRVHSYLYSGEKGIYRATAKADGSVEGREPLLLVPNVSGVTLWKTEGDYLYYYASGTNGNNLTRVNYKGTQENYNPLLITEEYKPAKILNVDWNSSWYKPEFIENCLFFSNARSYGSGSTSFNYVYVVDMNGANGIMNAEELKAFNDKYKEVNDYIEELSSTDGDLQSAVKYYFGTGETTYFEDVLQEAKEKGYKPYYLYSEYAINEFRAFSSRTVSANVGANDYSTMFKDDAGNYYDVESYFVNRIGKVKESDEEAIADGWKNSLRSLTEEEKKSWATWQKVLLGVGIGVGVLAIAAAITIPLVLRSKKKKAQAEADKEATAVRKKIVIDTTDDKSIDVYSDEEPGEEGLSGQAEEGGVTQQAEEPEESTDKKEE